MKKYKILAINPGSTSTKVAIYNGREQMVNLTLRHSSEELAAFPTVMDQFGFRRDIILKAVSEAGFETKELDAVVGRGGLIKPIPSGVYVVNERMIDDLKYRPLGHHASNLGALLAYEIANGVGAQAFIADPVVVDELQDVARITGFPQIQRASIFHALNQKAVARSYAESRGLHYEDMNIIVAHLGGGISIGAHRRGEVVDVNNALNGEGPFSPERAGTLPVMAVAEMCFSGKYTLEEISSMVSGHGGLVAHLGTNNAKDVSDRALAGDKQAQLLVDAMSYNIGKAIGAMGAVLEGKVDAIIITGGIAYDKYICDYIRRMVSFAGEVVVHPGEDELEALSDNARRVLEGKLAAKTYD